MKQPKMSNATPPTKERDQGSIRGSGINEPMVKETIPQVKPGVTYGKPTQTQKM